MAIIKSKHSSNYTVLPNEIFKAGLSIDAIGLLSYFLSLPHDWVIYKTQLSDQLSLGREKLDRIFKELQTAGFVISVKKHDETGKISYDHIVYDIPFNGEPHTGLPHTAEPSTVKPLTAEPLTANPQLLSTKELSTNKQSKHNKVNISFGEFWDMYDKKVGDKGGLEKKWLKLTDAERSEIMLYLPKYKTTQPDKKFRKNPDTFLNQRGWEHELVGYKEPVKSKFVSYLKPEDNQW
jgi:hypothetical protein